MTFFAGCYHTPVMNIQINFINCVLEISVGHLWDKSIYVCQIGIRDPFNQVSKMHGNLSVLISFNLIQPI